MKIDYVFPYVNSSDEIWINDYNKFSENKIKSDDTGNGIVRYDDFGLLKYKFRSIEKNLPWINKIFFIVAYESQIPEWLDTTNPKLRIVYHREFIPQEFLPLFNSSAIEMFIHNIPDLSEYFIYSNDDVYEIKYQETPNFYIENNLPIYNIKIRNMEKLKNSKRSVTLIANSMFRNIYNLLKLKYIPNINILNKMSKHIKLPRKIILRNLSIKRFYISPDHGSRLFIKSTMKECYTKYKTQIHESITKFRDHNNFNIYLFWAYNIQHRKYLSKYNTEDIYFFVLTEKKANNITLLNKLKNILTSDITYELCLDFNSKLNDMNIVTDLLDIKFSEKSNFEK